MHSPQNILDLDIVDNFFFSYTERDSKILKFIKDPADEHARYFDKGGKDNKAMLACPFTLLDFDQCDCLVLNA
jgi:hypothetical protein